MTAAPEPCTVAAAAAHLPGTAPRATCWLVIEQHGPYGPKALLESGLPHALGEALSAPAWKAVKVILARPTGRHAGDQQARAGRVWLADAVSGRMVQRTVSDLTELLDLNPADLTAGHLPAWPAAAGPQFFVCTNGRRDVCCARLGKAAVTDIDDDDVWESSHLGGHRFAPTGVLLPWGYVYGRLDADAIRDIMAAARAGVIHAASARGRSSLTPSGQCADLHLRAGLPPLAADGIHVLAEAADDDGRTLVTLRSPEPEAITVVVQERLSAPTPPSCGATAEPQRELFVVGILGR